MSRTLLAALAALVLAPSAGPAGEFPLRDGMRVVFLGDSITHGGAYIQDIEAYLVTRFPGRKVEIVNIGLSSETAAGTSEPGHPSPRPDVHERLGRALELARPDLVVACYGMNDGIYHPFDDGRFEAYREGIESLVGAVREAGAVAVIGTPPPFDARPIAAKLRPIGMEGYGYQHPYAGYDEVLGRYADWLVSKRRDGWKVVDVHGVVAGYVAMIRESDPDYTLARDGVHPDATGHWLIARAYLDAWDAPGEVDSASVDAEARKATVGRVDSISKDGETLSFSWTTRIPMPHDPKWDPRLVGADKVDARFNRHRLTVAGLHRPRYGLFEGDRKVGEVAREELTGGLDLLKFPDLSTNRRAAEIRPLVVRRRSILGAAWLQAVGHKLPGLPDAGPLDQAKRVGDELDRQIRSLANPVPVSLRLAPIAD